MARIRSRVMVGRDRELSALQAAVETVRSGAVQLVLVTGEAGIGKSRLVAELVGRLADALVLESHGIAASSGEIPFAGVAELVMRLVRAEPGALLESERRALAPLLPGATGPGDRIVMMAAALDALERLSGDRLLLWVVDDLQWVDAASRDLLDIVLRTGRGHRLLVLATVRTEPGNATARAIGGGIGRASPADTHAAIHELARLPNAETVRLRPLSATDVRRQLAGLDVALDAGTRARIVELSGGIPFLVEELAAGGGDPGDVLKTDPRLDRLPPDTVRLVEAAAIGDGHLRLTLLGHVAGLTGPDLDRAVMTAVADGLLDLAADQDDVTFHHPLIREAIDRGIAPLARRGWHRRWAEVLEANPDAMAAAQRSIAVAQHWSRSDAGHRTLEAAARAAVAAGELDLHAIEAEMWAQVLDLWDGETPLAGLERYTRREIVRFWRWAVGQVDAERYTELLRDGVRTAADPSTRACLEFALLVDEGTSLDTDARPDALAELERRARTGPRDLVLAVFLNNLAEVVLNGGDRDRAHALAVESVEIFAERGSTRDVVRARTMLAYFEAADGAAERGIAQLTALLAEPGMDTTYVRRWVGNILMLLNALVGDARAANRAFEMVAATLDTRLDWPTYELQLNIIMRGWLDTGRWDHATRIYQELRPNWKGRLVLSDLHAARLELMRDGQTADPGRWTALPDQEVTSGGVDPVSARLIAAQVAGVAGDLPRMRRLVAPVWTETHPQYGEHALLGYLWTAVRDFTRLEVDAACDRPDPADRATAAAHLATIAEVAERMHRHGPLGLAWSSELEAQLARFGGADPTAVIDLFSAAVARWSTLGHLYDSAVCRLHRAEAAAALGDRADARADVQAALDTARSLPAGPLVERAEALRNRLGSAERTGGPLTHRELDVLALLSAGRTNKQIATELFISPKTTGIHVSRIIAKLGAGNRTEAVALARAAGLLGPDG